MRGLLIIALCALMAAPIAARSHERTRPGNTIIVPPDSHVIIVPNRKRSFHERSFRERPFREWRGRHREFPRSDYGRRRFHDRSAPALKWTTPGFSSGWTTERPGHGFGPRR